MARFIKAVLALSIAVIFFGIIYVTGKDKSGMPNIFGLGMKIASQASALKLNKAPQANITFDTQSQNSFATMPQQQQAFTPEQMQQLAAAQAELAASANRLAATMQQDAISTGNINSMPSQNFAQPSNIDAFPQAQVVLPTAPAQTLPAANALPQRPLQSMTPQELTEALMVSVSSNDLEKTKQILALGTDPNTMENATSATPLFTAIANNNPQMVQMLLDHGADVNQVNEKGSYPMHEVASGNGFAGDSKYRANEMIQSLIEHGADVNQKNAKGQTPIMLACKAGRTETLIFLLNKNAKTSIQDEKGRTVGDYSSEVPAKSCSDALRKFTKELL